MHHRYMFQYSIILGKLQRITAGSVPNEIGYRKVVLENDTEACSVSQSTTVRDSGHEDAAEQNETSNCLSLFCVRKNENP